MRFKGEKGKAWEALRRYVCERDGWKCCTCGRSKEQGNIMQAGHYQPMGKVGSNNTLSWDEMNIHCQCSYCNGVGQGEQEKMKEYIRRKYGHKVLKSILLRLNKVDPVKDWKEMTTKFKKLRNELLGMS